MIQSEIKVKRVTPPPPPKTFTISGLSEYDYLVIRQALEHYGSQLTYAIEIHKKLPLGVYVTDGN